MHFSEDIALMFHEYYTTLYNISNPLTPLISQGCEKLSQYILTTALPRLDQSAASSLSIPFTIKEIMQTIKALPSGKSLGPYGFSSIF